MKFIDFAGKEYKKDVNFYKCKRRTEEECRSNYQYQVGNVIEKLFENFIVLEEFPIIERLHVDFIVLGWRLIIEVDGAQHSEFSKFYHRDAEGFKQQKANDAKKENWAKLNEFTFIRIKYPEKDPQNIMKIIYNKLLEDIRENENGTI